MVGGVKIGNRLRSYPYVMGTLPGTFFISPHPFYTYPITPGDIEVFKGMDLTSLNLRGCRKLTGVFGLGWGLVGGVKIGNRLRPQSNTQITLVPGVFFTLYTSSYSFSLPR
jgi:hypothetical protein